MPDTKLSDKPWHQLTQDEKRAWKEAAETKGPVLFGGATIAPDEYRNTVVASWRRQAK